MSKVVRSVRGIRSGEFHVVGRFKQRQDDQFIATSRQSKRVCLLQRGRYAGDSYEINVYYHIKSLNNEFITVHVLQRIHLHVVALLTKKDTILCSIGINCRRE